MFIYIYILVSTIVLVISLYAKFKYRIVNGTKKAVFMAIISIIVVSYQFHIAMSGKAMFLPQYDDYISSNEIISYLALFFGFAQSFAIYEYKSLKR